MSRIWILLSAVLLTAANLSHAAAPNIVFILADDLGYGDLSCFGQKHFQTPHLDKLAKEGIRLTRHYSGNAVCAPSRCVLMTGKHPGHAEVRDNRELKPEGQFPLTKDAKTLASRLKMLGYTTGAFGKWGLGGPGTTGEPMNQGFDRFFGYNCQRVAHNYYPTYLWDNQSRLTLSNKAFPAHDKFKEGEDPTKQESYSRFRGEDYAPDRIRDAALQFLDANHTKPFFLYWPTTVPHLALQVPEESVKPFVGKFEETPYVGGKGYTPTWNPRATYAGMVTRMDQDVGKLLKRLDELKLTENTIVIFSSDNGPLYDQLGGTDSEFFNSAAGFRGRKGSLYEGGIHVPTIVRWPGKIASNTSSAFVSGFEDWLPTLLEIVGQPTEVKELDGVSLLPTLLGKPQADRPFLYREFPGYGGQQSIRVGNYKAIRQKLNNPKLKPKIETELYDLQADPMESLNLAQVKPDVVRKLEKMMQEQHALNKDFPMKALDTQ